MISFVQVGKTYPDGTVAVAATDLTAESGRITVLVGPSGSGKTTLLRMVNRMIEPTSGEILIDGVDVRSKSGAGAAARDRLRDPERRPVPAPDGAGQRDDRAAAAGLVQGQGAASGRWSC